MNLEQVVQQIRTTGVVTFEVLLRDVLAPAFLRNTWGQRWLGSIGAFAELIWQGASEAANVGFPHLAPNDALDYVGANENIERLIDEPDGTYRDRLRTPFSTWEESGRISGIEAQLSAWGLTGAQVYDMAAGWGPGDGNTYSAFRFWVVADAPATWSPLLIGDDFVLGDETVIGVAGMRQTDYRNIRRLVHKWRAGHATPVTFYLLFNGPLPDTTTADAQALVDAGDAADLPLTNPKLNDGLVVGDDFVLGWYIEPR